MRQLILCVFVGTSVALWGSAGVYAGSAGNGDVNSDNALDLSDAVYILAHLFQGGAPPEACAPAVEPVPLPVLLPATNQTVCYESTFARPFPLPLPIPDSATADLQNCAVPLQADWENLIPDPVQRQFYCGNALSAMEPAHVCSVAVADCVTAPPDCVTDPADCVTDPASLCFIKPAPGDVCFSIPNSVVMNLTGDLDDCVTDPGADCPSVHPDPAEGCFTSLPPGQDGFYETGCETAGRFVDNTDGTVTDLCTGLMWTQDIVDATGDGMRKVDDQVTWCEALNECEDLNFATHTDWRLPSIRELESIVDYSVLPAGPSPGDLSTPPDRVPMLDSAFADLITDPGDPLCMPPCPKDTGFLFWSSTSYDQGPDVQPGPGIGTMDLAHCLFFADSDLAHVLARWGGSMPTCLKEDNNCVCAGAAGCVDDERFDRIFARAVRTITTWPGPPGAGGAGGAPRTGQGAGFSGNGDVNGDNTLDLSDAVYLLAFLFQGGDPPVDCDAAGGGAGGDPDVFNPGRLTSTLTANCYSVNTASDPDEWQLAPSCAGLPCPGQDAFYQQEPHMNSCYGRVVGNRNRRFVGGGTPDLVTDQCTNLMWWKGAGLELGGRFDWFSAHEFAEALVYTVGQEFKLEQDLDPQDPDDEVRFDDWRVPNIRELETLRDFDAPAQSLAEPILLVSRRVAYLSSTTLPSQPNRAFGLNAGARVEYRKNDPTLHLRPCRTVTAAP